MIISSIIINTFLLRDAHQFNNLKPLKDAVVIPFSRQTNDTGNFNLHFYPISLIVKINVIGVPFIK